MEEKMKETELAFVNSIIGRLYSFLLKKSYNLTEDDEERVMKFAYEHRGFIDDVIVAIIEGMRIAQTVSIGSSSSGTGLQVDKKSDLEEHIKLGSEEFFHIKRGTPLKELMNDYCVRMSWVSVWFIFAGHHLSGEETPYELKMKDGDEIRAMRVWC